MRAFAIAITVLLLFAASMRCNAETDPEKNGAWLKVSIDTFNRVVASEYIDRTSSEFRDTEIFFAYVEGVLAVHRKNNLQASIFVTALQMKNGESSPVSPEQRIALAFAPLLRVPDEISRIQAVAIIEKYLKEHPQNWNLSAATIITTAFEDAFEK